MDADWELRLAAFDHLNRLRERSGGLVRIEDLEAGFDFGGERVPLINRQRGIWRPKHLGAEWPALSVTTAPRRPGKIPPYDDEIASDGGFDYRYEKVDPNTWTNRAVRRAMDLQRPLIYFRGERPGIYEAIYPVYVTADDPGRLTFRLESDVMAALAIGAAEDPQVVAARRAYATIEVKRRLHSRHFRDLVMRAYRTRCAVCRLHRDELLDAAHIIPDRDERGHPEVPNGLALCKIHHAAFDTNILGVAPDCVIHIRHDILEEHDGPMLQHGLKEMNGAALHLPRSEQLRPKRDYLAERFERFQAA